MVEEEVEKARPQSPVPPLPPPPPPPPPPMESDKFFSCFLCRKKCFSKEKLYTHFCSHFRRKKRPASNIGAVTEGAESDENSSPEPPDVDKHARRRRRKQRNRTGARTDDGAVVAGEDADSGCQSVSSTSTSSSGASSSSDQVESDCFLGDSESSDSDDGKECSFRKKREWLQLENRRRRAAAATYFLKGGSAKKERLSLAERQLDNNDTNNLSCLTCLKRFANCQNLRRHLRLHIARDSITPDIEISPSNLGRHICDWCPARFENRSAARVHEKSHAGQDFKCHVCERVYADRYSLRYHLRKHGIGRQIRYASASQYLPAYVRGFGE